LETDGAPQYEPESAPTSPSAFEKEAARESSVGATGSGCSPNLSNDAGNDLGSDSDENNNAKSDGELGWRTAGPTSPSNSASSSTIDNSNEKVSQNEDKKDSPPRCEIAQYLLTKPFQKFEGSPSSWICF
jgi:hypothetical protein